jgi:PAS domain-containing protein
LRQEDTFFYSTSAHQKPKQGEAMSISSALATQLLNAAPDPTVMVDSEGAIIYANARVETSAIRPMN